MKRKEKEKELEKKWKQGSNHLRANKKEGERSSGEADEVEEVLCRRRRSANPKLESKTHKLSNNNNNNNNSRYGERTTSLAQESKSQTPEQTDSAKAVIVVVEGEREEQDDAQPVRKKRCPQDLPGCSPQTLHSG